MKIPLRYVCLSDTEIHNVHVRSVTSVVFNAFRTFKVIVKHGYGCQTEQLNEKKEKKKYSLAYLCAVHVMQFGGL